jgi:predicted nucleic acid-binding protein
MIYVPTDNLLWETVERMVWKLDRSGTVLPLTDLLIAAAAIRTGAVLLTFDKHFSQIPGVRAVDRLDT